MNNEELRKKAFKNEFKNLEDKFSEKEKPALLLGFQACWQLFMPHIEILLDDAKVMDGDLVYKSEYENEYDCSPYFIAKKYTQDPSHIFGYDADKIMQRGGKPCIKAKDLMGE